MNFELDKILLDDILFHMENQEGEFLFDAQERQIFDISNHQYDKDIDFGEDRFINIPSWDSGDGFRLMEKFISGLKNPVLREELAAALGRNKGVFRAFRDVLNQYPETEKQWYRFKDQEMKNEVLQWYNALREEWGLQPIGFEPEDNSCLVLEDFVVKEKTINKELNTFAFIAENAEGELTAGITASRQDSFLRVDTLEVKDEYRGMGIGKTLLAKILEKADELKLDVTIDLPHDAGFFARTLYLENFTPTMQRFVRKTY